MSLIYLLEAVGRKSMAVSTTVFPFDPGRGSAGSVPAAL